MKDIIKRLRSLFDVNNIDGYIIPKNDEFFSEFANNDRLKKLQTSQDQLAMQSF